MKRLVGWITVSLVLWGPSAFGQTAPADGSPKLLTLDEAVALALEKSPSIEASRETLAATDARVDQTKSGFLPQLLLSLGYRRATANSPVPPYLDPSVMPESFSSFIGREDPTSYNNYSASVTLNHTIWDFGKTLEGYRAVRELRTASGADMEASQDQVRLNTVVSYYLVLATEEAVKVAEETAQQMELHLAMARAQTEAGVRQRIDVTRAESDLAAAKLSQLKARNGVRIARVGLMTALGLDMPMDFRVERPAASAEPGTEDLEVLVEQALQRRPDVCALRARVRAATHQTVASRAGYFPSLGLSAGANVQGYHLEPDSLPYNWSVGLSMSWNALAPLPVSAAHREAEANLRALQASARGLELGIRAEVESAALALGEARERLEPAAALLASAAETLRLAEGRYGEGTGNIVEVTDAQAMYTQARLSRIQAEFDVETARARLERALGSPAGSKGE